MSQLYLFFFTFFVFLSFSLVLLKITLTLFNAVNALSYQFCVCITHLIGWQIVGLLYTLFCVHHTSNNLADCWIAVYSVYLYVDWTLNCQICNNLSCLF